MSNMLSTIVPKSDQLNSDDLIGGRTLTITITRVVIGDSKEQPVELHYAGGLPFRPCKSMRRVLVELWGPDGKAYEGRSLTLYRDANVTWAGEKVGGLRISHMSHITEARELSLTQSKKARKTFKVLPLTTAGNPATVSAPTPTDYFDCSQDEFAALEKRRADAWKSLGTTSKEALKAASEAAKLRLAGTPTNDPDALDAAIAAFTAAGGIIEEFAENARLSVAEIRASKGDARAKWTAELLVEAAALEKVKRENA